MSPAPDDLHSIAPSDFLDEVHSFEFWFQSVVGYLSERPHGRRSDVVAEDLGADDREALITVLCSYCLGETAALEGSSGLVAVAPNRQAKIFLATQAVDEARHLEVLLGRLVELGVEEPEEEILRRAPRSLLTFKERLLSFVRSDDWEAAVFAQNVVLEAMEFTVFEAHAARADAITRDLLEGIIRDERRHMGFGENDLGRRLANAPELRARLLRVRGALDPLVLDIFEETMAGLDMPRDERPDVGRSYLAVVDRLGLSP